jgi:hypothetical protein
VFVDYDTPARLDGEEVVAAGLLQIFSGRMLVGLGREEVIFHLFSKRPSTFRGDMFGATSVKGLFGGRICLHPGSSG